MVSNLICGTSNIYDIKQETSTRWSNPANLQSNPTEYFLCGAPTIDCGGTAWSARLKAHCCFCTLVIMRSMRTEWRRTERVVLQPSFSLLRHVFLVFEWARGCVRSSPAGRWGRRREKCGWRLTSYAALPGWICFTYYRRHNIRKPFPCVSKLKLKPVRWIHL